MADKHGLQMVRSKSFVDASDNVLFTRKLKESPYKIERAGFNLEIQGAKDHQKKEISVKKDIGLTSASK
jgi:hypothetical protein